MTVEELYEQTIKPLSEEDRIALATWIFSDLGISGAVDYKDYWTDEDLAEVQRYSLERAGELLDGDADDATAG